MFTPQQIEQVSFSRATFGGYDMQSVDEFLGPLTDDYVALYKENALLKSKMRVLLTNLEQYRNNEASMRQAIVDAQKTCDTMVQETEAKCAQMLSDTSVAAAESNRLSEEQISLEQAKLEAARKESFERISAIEEQLKACLASLAAIKEGNLPTEPDPKEAATKAMADEIAQNLENLMGAAEDITPNLEPNHPSAEAAATAKFTNLQFGRNYDANRR